MAQREPPSAASQIWPNLARGTPNEVAQRGREPRSVADAMWPRPTPTPVNPYREILLRNLRETRLQLEALRKR
jgi:hypothetical protein